MIIQVNLKSIENIDIGINLEDYEFHKVSEFWNFILEFKFVEKYVNIDDKYSGLDKPVESKS